MFVWLTLGALFVLGPLVGLIPVLVRVWRLGRLARSEGSPAIKREVFGLGFSLLGLVAILGLGVAIAGSLYTIRLSSGASPSAVLR